MKGTSYCTCCLSKECYKDMANTYYIGNKQENYIQMLYNTFNVNVIKNDDQRCLICEECVSSLRNAAAFKTKALYIQEMIKNNLCWENNDTYHTRTEDDEVDIFDDNTRDSDLRWKTFDQDASQKGEVFYITLESNSKTQKHKTKKPILKKTKYFEIESVITNKKTASIGVKDKIKVKNPSTKEYATEKDELNSQATLVDKEDKYLDRLNNDFDSDNDNSVDPNIEALNEFKIDRKSEDCIKIDRKSGDSIKKDRKSGDSFKIDRKSGDSITITTLKKLEEPKIGTANQTKDLNTRKPRATSEEQLVIKHKSEDTIKLVQNSNICLFRSLRNKFGCNFCKLNFPVFSQLKEHSLTHKNPKHSDLKRLRGLSYKNADISDLQCNLCHEKCANLEYLMDHLKKEHNVSFHGTEYYLVPYKLQDGYQCVSCELKFNTYMRLSVHMNSHYTNNVCETCGSSFINRSGLRTHLKAMHKEKKCSRCPAIFVTNSSKIKHLKQVHGVNPSKRSICNICNKTFKYTYILDEHKIVEHGFKRPAVSTCEDCGKVFTTALKLKTHVRSVHMRERKYPCTKCDMRFFTTCDQRRHERTHVDIRSFCCSYCDAKFKSKDSWRRHVKRQHGHAFERTMK